MVLFRVILRIQASLIGHPIKIKLILLLLWAVKNIKWGQECSVSHCITNTAHSLPEKLSLFGPFCRSAERLPGLKVKYTDSIWKVAIRFSPESGEIKRMRMQLIPGSPFPSPLEPGYEANLNQADGDKMVPRCRWETQQLERLWVCRDEEDPFMGVAQGHHLLIPGSETPCSYNVVRNYVGLGSSEDSLLEYKDGKFNSLHAWWRWSRCV